MASTFSTDLKLELMVTGENAGTWGDKTNTNLNLIQQAIAGFQSISIAGGPQTTALTMDNAALSNARNAVVKLTGTITGDQIVTVPTGIEKTYIVQNGTVGAFTVEFKQAGGTGTTFSTTDKSIKIVFADGTNINAVDLDTLSGQIATAQLENLAVTSAKLASFAVTTARVASYAVTTSRLATNAVTAIKITQSTITQSKLAANSVGANQLISTGVTAASYTAATITVDADGRITAASSGSAGAGMEIPTRYTVGPASGTHTAQPTANRLGVYMFAGGGGGGYSGNQGGNGGTGGFGFFNKPITQPFAQPFSLGAGGNAMLSMSGGAGGATNFTNVGTVNAGNGGMGRVPSRMGAVPGNAGTAPGASLTYPTAFVNFVVGGSSTPGQGGFSLGGATGSDVGMTPCQPNFQTAAQAGGPGGLVIFENTGT
jgi:hypothetical protein